MPLPSGRFGNSLAVALEMQFYQGALFMIENADELGIEDVKQTFELSQLDFEKTKKADTDDSYKNNP